ncbi:Beta-1,4-mannosyltransferase egh, partial [Stegodyphus mimosarum]
MTLRFCKSDALNTIILSSNVKHTLHCVLFFILLLVFEIIAGGICIGYCDIDNTDPFEKYGYIPAIFLYLLRFLTFLALPQCVCNCLGLLFFNAFPEKVQLKGSPLLAPF